MTLTGIHGGSCEKRAELEVTEVLISVARHNNLSIIMLPDE